MSTPNPVRRGLPLRDVLRPRTRRVDLLVSALLLVLGFGLAVQVRSTQDEGVLTSARQEDLVQILDDLRNRGDRLRDEVESLSAAKDRLSSGSGDTAAALREAQRRTQVLGIIAGTLPATGPGILVTVEDPGAQVSASLLLDALEELRNAGAEAMQLEGTGTNGRSAAVRVVASTSLVDEEGGVAVDGVSLRAPYRFVVVGDASTLAGALAIPGGVEDTVRQQGGTARVERRETVQVRALHALERPRYARPQ
jgi:uncharacterized protein YlxW (UPF0749 family)